MKNSYQVELSDKDRAGGIGNCFTYIVAAEDVSEAIAKAVKVASYRVHDCQWTTITVKETHQIIP